ncbi:hypothetical protein [uncultured Bacteroides sp.]|uniref:hypothetical protein n=1 Tax=uncultured Bacteroides sp. TaxID=162156 RepID=UPI002AA7E1EB|nr:hypothetical protein [uncultured Bacteroides sp.]
MKCPKCNGSGTVPNDRYYNYCNAVAYERGINPNKRCAKCNGKGFILSNFNEILDMMNVAINNNQGLSLDQLKEIKNLLIKK